MSDLSLSSTILRRRSHQPHNHSISLSDSCVSQHDDMNSPTRRSSTLCFSPLPPITASPLCTPPASLHSKTLSFNLESDGGWLNDVLPVQGEQGQLSSPICMMASNSHFSPPTWTSTPPTPPQNPHRRSTFVTRRPSVPLLSPSASFPAMPFPHASDAPSYAVKRCASLPAMESSTPFPSFTTAPPYAVEACQFVKPDGKRKGTPLRTVIPTFTSDGVESEDAFSVPRQRPLFHIGQSSDNEDDACLKRYGEFLAGCSTGESGSSSSTEQSSEEILNSEISKDNLRRYHVLMELLSTEVGYLTDLRTLVNVYLPLIDTATTRPLSFASSALPFSRSHSTSFLHSSISRYHVNSYPLLQVNDGSTSPSPSPEGCNSSTVNAKDKPKTPPRPLFSSTEVEILARNAADILQLHERLTNELRLEMAQFGLEGTVSSKSSLTKGMNPSNECIEAAIRAVAVKFTTEASKFDSYQTFCAGHSEAAEVVRKFQQYHTAEWDAFEQRAAFSASDTVRKAQGQAGPQQIERRLTHRESDLEERMRSHGGASTLKPRTRTSTAPNSESIVDYLDCGIKGKQSTLHHLSLMDYLIKPVQRICKYPLLLGQLKSRASPANNGTHGSKRGVPHSDVNVVVENALLAMRRVASAVDEARRCQDLSIQSSLIVSRIFFAAPNHLSDANSPTLTPTFLTSLGACLLAGSLDVIHYQEGSATIKAKYLGAFLYTGGYLVLVKVLKGKIYEPRHWFSLEGFEVTNLTDDEAMLSCSFRLTCKGHHFELAAACQREKETWVSSLRKSVTTPPTWMDEPLSSLCLGRGDEPPVSLFADEHVEAISSLPTIQSIPELAGNHDCDGPSLNPFPNGVNGLKSSLKPDITIWTDLSSFQLPPSRRSSSASVKAIFSPLTSDPNTIVIRRSSPSARLQVDQGLLDVISKQCINARSHASMHDEELFQAPRITRSSSGLSVMSVVAKNRLSRHESVRVPRRRSITDAGGRNTSEMTVFSIEPRKRMMRTDVSVSRRNKKTSITIPRSAGNGAKRGILQGHWDLLSDSSPSSQCSSRSMTDPSSTLVSPTSEFLSLPSSPIERGPNEAAMQAGHFPAGQSDHRPKRTRSMVESVRRLFCPRRMSLVLSTVDPPSSDPCIRGPLPSPTPNPGLFKRWACGPLHRRVRSAPNVPIDCAQTISTTYLVQASIPDSHLGDLPFSTAANDGPFSRYISPPSPTNL